MLMPFEFHEAFIEAGLDRFERVFNVDGVDMQALYRW